MREMYHKYLSTPGTIHSIERMTGIHRDTIMRLGVRIGEGCSAAIMQELRDA